MDNNKAWERLQQGKAWKQRLDPPIYDEVNTNWEMYKGNQYINSGAKDNLPKPVFNMIKRIISFFVASLTSSPADIKFSNFANQDGKEVDDEDIAKLNSSFANFEERTKLQSLIRDAYKDAAITGDFAFHMFFDIDKKPYGGKYSDVMGELCIELVDGVNVYFGNPNNRNVQEQPYIIIAGRDMITDLQEEYARENKDELELQSDSDTDYQAGLDSRIEIEGDNGSDKATYALMYELKENKQKEKTIHASKSVGGTDIYTDKDLGLTLYPVIFDNYERAKNNYHGLALCTAIVPNQIFINRMFALVMKSLMDTAFPRLFYDSKRIDSPTNRVGATTGVKNLQPGENVANVASYLRGGDMSAQIAQIIDKAWAMTKETLGAEDALLGSVNPEQASGIAISVTAKQAAIPLLNPKNNMYDALECLANIYADMVGNYYGERPVVIEREDDQGQKMNAVEMFDYSKLKEIYLSIKIDVGAGTYYDEMAKVLTYENYLREGHITFEETLAALPDDYFPNKAEILERLEAEKEPSVPMEVVAQIIEQMPPDLQQAAVEYIQQTEEGEQQ